MSDDPHNGWLIHKKNRGWYRPNAQGYTPHHHEAGRYSREEALARVHPNGLDGPRDGLSMTHENDLPNPIPTDADRIAALEAALATARNDALEGAGAAEKKVLADIVLGAVLHPQNDKYELIRREILDRARFLLDIDDIVAAAVRAREALKERSE